MAAQQQPDISAILAALSAAQRNSATPGQAAPIQQPPAALPGALPPGFPNTITTPTPPNSMPSYGLPAPVSSGSIDLSSIRPVNSGSVSIGDGRKGSSYGSGGGQRDDPRLAGRRRSRSRSPRRDGYRDSYPGPGNPYREDRREYNRGGSYGRDRSRSPARRGRYSPGPRGNYARERTPTEDNEIIIIDAALVGLVIGRQGENLKRIEHSTQTKIQFMTKAGDGGPRRECRITGSPQQRLEAKREINRIIEENGGNPPQETARAGAGSKASKAAGVSSLREGENSVQIMVPDRTVGLIIGRGGETIRDLQERSGCHVNIVGENKSVNGLRPVNLIGTPEAAQKAKDLIMEIVESDTRGQGGGPPPKDHGRPAAGGNNGGMDSFNKGNKKISVPSEAVGMIIGKGGETIREIQNATGAKINVFPPSGADREREIDLVGTRQAIEAAERAIRGKVDALREKTDGRAAGRGPRDGVNDRPSGQGDASAYNNNATGAPMTAGTTPGVDPYAAWGGYQNYVAMWYAAVANQQQAGQAPPGGQNPPGSS